MSTRIEVLEASLAKKQAKLNELIEAHFSDVKSANGQPLNDKRCGRSTMGRWQKQDAAIARMFEEIAKTENAIGYERDKQRVADNTLANIPAPIVKLVESGTLKQWRKYPHIFFVDGVDKARILWDFKKKQLMNSYLHTVKDRDQFEKFKAVFNGLLEELKAEH